jgi:hypothetical protein
MQTYIKPIKKESQKTIVQHEKTVTSKQYNHEEIKIKH